MRIALYQPDIPQNTGAILRLAACWGLAVDIIGPMGFAWDDWRLRRAGMDYLDRVETQRHLSWSAYLAWREELPLARRGRLILITTQGGVGYQEIEYQPEDVLLLGQESAGAPATVHAAANERVRIPMRPDLRSLNVALAAAIVAGEAMRQRGFQFQ
jgi:tRNA (cytidine/uridine-2'-O-)-methyltransferase